MMEIFLIRREDLQLSAKEREILVQIPRRISTKNPDFSYYVNRCNIKKYYKTIKFRVGSKVLIRDDHKFQFGYNPGMEKVKGNQEIIKSFKIKEGSITFENKENEVYRKFIYGVQDIEEVIEF